MDRNKIIGIILITAIFIGFQLLFPPTPTPQTDSERADSTATAASSARSQDPGSITPATSAKDSIFSDSIPADSNTVHPAIAKYGDLGIAGPTAGDERTIETDLYTARISPRGGFFSYFQLKDYVTYDSSALVLWDQTQSRMNLVVQLDGKLINTTDLPFAISTEKSTLRNDETAVWRARAGTETTFVEYVYKFKGNSYDIDFEVITKGLETPSTGGLAMELAHAGYPLEKDITMERNKSSIYFKPNDGGRDYLSETSDDSDRVDEPLDWVAFKKDFFSVIVLAKTPFATGAELETAPFEDRTDLTQRYAARLPIQATDAGNTSAQMMLYFGPNKYKILKQYDYDLDRVIDLGWGIFGWVNKFLVIPIFDFLERFNLGYGLIILLLTIAIKIIISPLTYRNYLSSAKMKVLRPDIEALNEKFKNADAMKKQQATLDLYRKTGVNPFSGCVPLLIQMPILYAMFRFFPASIELRQEKFLWADDLSSYDSIASLPFSIPAYGDHVSLFPTLMCVSTLIYTMYNMNNMPTQTQPGRPNMKVLMYIFPVMMLFIFNSFASGLSYYYFLANVISVIQMLVIKNFVIDEDKIHARIEENKQRPQAQTKSKFQQRLEEMARQRSAK